jgi:hypothetical protein
MRKCTPHASALAMGSAVGGAVMVSWKRANEVGMGATRHDASSRSRWVSGR